MRKSCLSDWSYPIYGLNATAVHPVKSDGNAPGCDVFTCRELHKETPGLGLKPLKDAPAFREWLDNAKKAHCAFVRWNEVEREDRLDDLIKMVDEKIRQENEREKRLDTLAGRKPAGS